MSIRLKHLASVGAVIACLLLAQQAAALTHVRVQCPTGSWEIGAHALYFVPVTCPYAYASVSTATQLPLAITSGRAQVIPCRADWGFRAFGNYVDGCTFVGLSYQWLEVTTTRAVVSADTVLIQGGRNVGPGKATGQTGIEYHNVDVRLGRYLRRGCNSVFYLYGNARWVDLSYRRTARIFITGGAATGTFEDVREKSQLEGGAIGIGLGGEFDIWCGIGAFIDGNVLGVIGERSIKEARYRELLVNGLFTLRQESYPSDTCVIPEVDFRIGINYTYAHRCWKLVAELGYEVDYFWHGSMFPDLTGNLLTNDGAGRNFVPVCEDLGFSGLFVGARLIF